MATVETAGASWAARATAVCIALWLLIGPPATNAQLSEPPLGEPQPASELHTLVPADVLPINVPPAAPLLIAAVRELLVGSPTFRQMVEVLKKAPHVIVLLRPSQEPRQAFRSLRGRGRLSVGRGRIVGVFEIPDGNFHERLAIVAHEIAHAVEVALLPGINDLEDLRRLLLQRGGLPTSRSRFLPIETFFPAAVQQIVLQELAGGDVKAGRLAEVGAQYGLSWSDDEPAVATCC